MLLATLLHRLFALLQACRPAGLLLGGWFGLATSRRRRWALRRHGQPATATVVAVAAADEGDVLHLRFTTLTGQVVDWPKATYVRPNRHFVGDRLPVRYWPRHPRRCLLLADMYTNALRESLWFWLGFALLCYLCWRAQ